MRYLRRAAAWITLTAIALTACAAPGGAPSAADEAGAGGATSTGLKAVYISTGPIGVDPFLELIAEGLHQGGGECGVETDVIESTDITQMEDSFRAAINEGVDLIVANSFDSLDAIDRLGSEFPDQQWAIVDTGSETNPNVRGIVFREHEGMYLIGAIMGLLATGRYDGFPESDVIGMVGAIDLPFIRRWYVGFAEGVHSVDPDYRVLESWGNSFNDPATSKELALAQFDQTAQYIAAVSASGNTGIFEAAAERGFYTSGVDKDQRPLGPEYILESMVKRTDVGVIEAVCDLARGEFTGGFHDYGLAENGVGPAVVTLDELETAPILPDEVVEEIRLLKEQIIAGEIVVTDYLAEGSE